MDDPSSEDVEGVGGLALPFDRCCVGGTKPAHDDVRMGREVIEERTGLRSQNLDFGKAKDGRK